MYDEYDVGWDPFPPTCPDMCCDDGPWWSDVELFALINEFDDND